MHDLQHHADFAYNLARIAHYYQNTVWIYLGMVKAIAVIGTSRCKLYASFQKQKGTSCRMAGAYRGVVPRGLGAPHTTRSSPVEVLLHYQVNGRELPPLKQSPVSGHKTECASQNGLCQVQTLSCGMSSCGLGHRDMGIAPG